MQRLREKVHNSFLLNFFVVSNCCCLLTLEKSEWQLDEEDEQSNGNKEQDESDWNH